MNRIAVVAIIVVIGPTSCAFGTTYTYTDSKGTMAFVDDPGKIPDKYRKTMKELGDGDDQSSSQPQIRESASEGYGRRKGDRGDRMPRIARGHSDGQIYHVLNRGNGRQDVFHEDN